MFEPVLVSNRAAVDVTALDIPKNDGEMYSFAVAHAGTNLQQKAPVPL